MSNATPPADDPQSLSELLAELQATAEQLGSQLSDLGRLGRQSAVAQAEQLPAVRRVLELAPPELRARIASAANHGLLATRDLADWLLAQMGGPAPEMPEPEELPITPIGAPRIVRVPTTWILTASVENHAATEARGFSVIGIKERNRRRAMEIEPGDVLVLYLTKVSSFAGAIRVTGELFEDRERIWPVSRRTPTSTRGGSRRSRWSRSRASGGCRPRSSTRISSTCRSGPPSIGSSRSRAAAHGVGAGCGAAAGRLRAEAGAAA